MSMSDRDDEIRRLAAEYLRRERNPYDQPRPAWPEPHSGTDPLAGGYGPGASRPQITTVTGAQILAGIVLVMLLPAVVVGLIAYLVAGLWPALWSGLAAFILIWVIAGAIGGSRLR